MASAQAQQHAPIVADPLAFDPDFRWFEPIYDMDIADMKPKKRANTGWFATYDRLNLYASRPETEDPNSAESNLDSGWGHRYELGFMLPDEDTGMLFSWTNAAVDKGFVERNYRLNLLNEDELTGGAVNAGPPFGREALPFFSNNLGYNYRFVDEIQTLNTVDFDSYELSKTWRLEPYHYGGMLEPMLGVRWFRIDDVNQRQDYRNTDDPADALLGPQSLAVLYGGDTEQLTTNRAITDNEAITAQAGFRYFKYRDRFMFSTDFRVFAGGNFQNSQSDRLVETLIYGADDVALGDDPDTMLYERSNLTFSRNEEFFLGFDVRGEMGYQLTKSISVRAGFQLIDVARGLWRGGDIRTASVPGGDNDQDLQMFGGTFGLTLNR